MSRFNNLLINGSSCLGDEIRVVAFGMFKFEYSCSLISEDDVLDDRIELIVLSDDISGYIFCK